MRLKFSVSLALSAVLMVSGGAMSWAQKGSGKGKKSDELVPDSVNRQFQWEEKVVGPKNEGVDHKKIAAMQEQARREDAARRKAPPPPKKQRTDGVAAPASSTIPTQDIEKPTAPGTARKPTTAKKVEPPHKPDALDNLLAEEGAKPGAAASSASGRRALGSLLAVDDANKRPAPAPAAAPAKKPAKHHR